MEQQSSQKSEPQVLTHNININANPFYPRTDYVFTNSEEWRYTTSCQEHWFKKFPQLHYDEKYFRVFFFISFRITFFEV